MSDVIYRVTYDDGSTCHTAYRPLADVWAKRQGAKLEEIPLTSPTRIRIVHGGDSMSDRYERAFTGANRTAATWAAFQAGWNAAKTSDKAIYDGIAERYWRDIGEPLANSMANRTESFSSPIATVYDPYDTPGIEWHCQHPPAEGTKLYAAPVPAVMRECCAEGCEWVGYTDRMLGSIGPLCPECGEVTEPSDGASLVDLRQGDGIVAGSGDVDQRVPVPAAGADEVAANLVNVGLDGSEHDRKEAAPTGPHGSDATPAKADETVPCDFPCCAVHHICTRHCERNQQEAA